MSEVESVAESIKEGIPESLEEVFICPKSAKEALRKY